MDLKIPYKKVTNREDAYKAAKSLLTPEYLEKFQIKFDLSFDDAEKKACAKGSGFLLELLFHEEACQVNLDLSFLLKPLKNSILEKVKSQIERNL